LKEAGRQIAADRTVFVNRRRAEVRRILYGSKDVPYAKKLGLDRYIEDRFGDLTAWSPDELGQELGLKFATKDRMDIRTIRCVDMTPEQVSAKYRERGNPGAAARQQRKREKDRAKKAGETKSVVLLGMIGSEWVSTIMLAEKTERVTQFQKPTGGRMDRHSRRRAINRALDELVAAGEIVERDPSDSPRTPTGRPVRWVKQVSR
jgi:hypothetical protein